MLKTLLVLQGFGALLILSPNSSIMAKLPQRHTPGSADHWEFLQGICLTLRNMFDTFLLLFFYYSLILFPLDLIGVLQKPKFETPVPTAMAVRGLLLVPLLICEVTLMYPHTWDVPRVQPSGNGPAEGGGLRCEGALAFPAEGERREENLLLVMPHVWAQPLGHAGGSQGVSSFFLWGKCGEKWGKMEPVPWQCFILVYSPVAFALLSVPAEHQPSEKCESRTRVLWQAQICWLPVIHIWGTTTWAFVLAFFLLLMKRSREEQATTSCHIFGQWVMFPLSSSQSRVRAATQIVQNTLCCCHGHPLQWPDKLHMLRCFSKDYFSCVCVFFSCWGAFKSVCGWSLRSAVPPLLVSVSGGSWCIHNYWKKKYILLHFSQRSRIIIYANNYLNFHRNLSGLLFLRLFC